MGRAGEPSGAFVYRLAMSRNTLFAGRTDGLWRRSTDTASVPGESHTDLVRRTQSESCRAGRPAAVHVVA